FAQPLIGIPNMATFSAPKRPTRLWALVPCILLLAFAACKQGGKTVVEKKKGAAAHDHEHSESENALPGDCDESAGLRLDDDHDHEHEEGHDHEEEGEGHDEEGHDHEEEPVSENDCLDSNNPSISTPE